MFVTRARLPMLVGALMAVSLVAAGCGSGDSSPESGKSNGLQDIVKSQDPAVPKPSFRPTGPGGATGVAGYRRLSVSADSGTLSAVNVTSKSGPVPGAMSGDKKA